MLVKATHSVFHVNEDVYCKNKTNRNKSQAHSKITS
jgi:hypothetical protein